MPSDAKGKVIYAFGAYLVKENTGGVHLTPRKDTEIMIADGALPRAKALLASGIEEVTEDDKDAQKLSKAPIRTS